MIRITQVPSGEVHWVQWHQWHQWHHRPHWPHWVELTAAHRERGTGTVGEKANESGKMIESSGDTGMLGRKFELLKAARNEDLIPKQAKPSKINEKQAISGG